LIEIPLDSMGEAERGRKENEPNAESRIVFIERRIVGENHQGREEQIGKVPATTWGHRNN
jgi:hypothetical protein